MKPLTDWEKNGSFTSRRSEEVFFETIASETDLVYSLGGRSSSGKPIWKVELGNQTLPAFLLIAGVHGPELSTREGALMWLRDLAYSNDSRDLDFLSKYRIVMITPLNADSVDTPRKRRNDNNVDLNRDWLRASQPETRTAASIISDVKPLAYLDLHEWSTDLSIDMATEAGNPLRPAEGLLYSISGKFIEELFEHMSGLGYAMHRYPNASSTSEGQGTSRSAGIDFHAMGVLLETKYSLPMSRRITGAFDYIHFFQDWLADNKDDLIDAITQSLDRSLYGLSSIYVKKINDDDTSGPWIGITPPDSYTLDSSIDIPEELFSIYGIEHDGRTVSTRQRSRGFVVNFLDPRSSDNIYRQPFIPTDALSGITLTDGRPQMIIKRGQIRYMSGGILKKTGGVREVL